MCSKVCVVCVEKRVIIFYLFLISRAMYFVFNKSHMFVRLNLVANLMFIYIYVNNTLPLGTDLYMKLHTELGRLWIV